MNANEHELSTELARIRSNGLLTMLGLAATKAGIELAYYIAIASRETNCRHILGDFQGGEYHGVGLTQIDIQHDIARRMRDDGTWKTDPQPLLDFGAALLATNLQAVRDRFCGQGLSGRDIATIAASGYNCGVDTAIEQRQHYGDSDRRTTWHNYGKDVMAREAVFLKLLGAN